MTDPTAATNSATSSAPGAAAEARGGRACRAGAGDARPGLRREEVAELAGIGVDWYVRLEQGRPSIHPSAPSMRSPARCGSARWSTASARAGRATATSAPSSPRPCPPALLRMVESLPQPAYVTGRRWDVWRGTRRPRRSSASAACPRTTATLLLCMLTNPVSRAAVRPRLGRRGASAWFRVPRDPRPVGRRSGLRGPADAAARGKSGVRRLVEGARHPRRARRHQEDRATRRRASSRFEHAQLPVNDDPALKLVIYTPV